MKNFTTENAASEAGSLPFQDSGLHPKTKMNNKVRGHFHLEPLSKLFSEPDEAEDWLVADLLTKSGISICAGKPKAGKSTLIRQLALSVSTGQPFLGFNVVKGSVLYLALEEKRSEVTKHFHLMGASGSEDIYVHAAPAPAKALDQLRPVVERLPPALVIIDPLFRFIRVKNGNDYSEVTNALEGVLALARQSGAHILLVHHMGKVDRGGADGILGSTALFGAVDTSIILSRTGAARTIQTMQRYGSDLPEKFIEFDAATKTMRFSSDPPLRLDDKYSTDIIQYLEKRRRPCSHQEIIDDVPGNKMNKLAALNQLAQLVKVRKIGDGAKGSPFCYLLVEQLETPVQP